MKKINEIFYSLQGEGYHTGIPAIFVRFSGCNMKCSFCDTSHEDGVMMSDEEIISEVVKYPAPMVILTGGEPGLWIDEALVDALHNEGKYVCVETNGMCVLPNNIDWVTCSPKEGGEYIWCRYGYSYHYQCSQALSYDVQISGCHSKGSTGCKEYG